MICEEVFVVKIKKLKNEINKELILRIALLLHNITSKNITVCKLMYMSLKKAKLKKNHEFSG